VCIPNLIEQGIRHNRTFTFLAIWQISIEYSKISKKIGIEGERGKEARRILSESGFIGLLDGQDLSRVCLDVKPNRGEIC